jgi:hypothetical protein
MFLYPENGLFISGKWHIYIRGMVHLYQEIDHLYPGNGQFTSGELTFIPANGPGYGHEARSLALQMSSSPEQYII